MWPIFPPLSLEWITWQTQICQWIEGWGFFLVSCSLMGAMSLPSTSSLEWKCLSSTSLLAMRRTFGYGPMVWTLYWGIRWVEEVLFIVYSSFFSPDPPSHICSFLLFMLFLIILLLLSPLLLNRKSRIFVKTGEGVLACLYRLSSGLWGNR